MRRSVRLGLFAISSILLFASVPRPAGADAATAEAELPSSRAPFFLVTTTTTTASAFDDLTRRPEYAVYADGTFIVQKSDGRLWGAALPRADVVEFLRFVLEEAKFPEIDMRYVVASPITTFTQFALETRSGAYAARRRAASLVGIGTKSGEKALASIETKLIALADRAQTVYTPGALLVVAKRITPNDQMPAWALDARVPFAQLIDAADVERKTGTVVLGEEADAVRTALAVGAEWRSGTLAAELRARPAMPHERPLVTPTPPPVPPAITDALPTPPSMHDALPTPPPMIPPPALPPPPAPTPAPAPAPMPVPVPTPPAPTVATPTAPALPTDAAPTAAGWKDDDVDYAGVQKIFIDFNRKTSGSPHGKFWTKTYDEFFAFEVESTEGKIRLIEPGNGTNSNMIRGLEGRPMLVKKPDGTVKEIDFGRMPGKGTGMPAAEIERLRRWIDHGAPRERPASGTPATPAPAPADVPPPPAPAPSPVPATPIPDSTTAAGDWNPDDVDFEGVQKIFVDFNRKTTGSPHGKFWTKSYDEFFAFEVESTEGKIRLIEPGNGKNSNMIRGLEGRPMLVKKSDGVIKEIDFGRMPGKGTGMPAAEIARLSRWIDRGAPRVRPTIAGPTPTASPSKPSATPTGETHALTLVGTDTAKLGTEGPAEAGGAAPAIYVARSAADWSAIFATRLPSAGAGGVRVARALRPLLETSVKGYDFAAAPLVLLVGPITDNYTADAPTAIDLLSDGSARLTVRHTHEDRTYAVAPELLAWWAVVRIDGACPDKLIVTDPAK